MGGYIAFEVMRQAPERVVKLALLDTAARANTPAHSERRRQQMTLVGEDDELTPLEVTQTLVEWLQE